MQKENKLLTVAVAEKDKDLESQEKKLDEAVEDKNKLQSEKEVLNKEKKSLEEEVGSLKGNIEELKKEKKQIEEKSSKKITSQAAEKVVPEKSESNTEASNEIGWQSMTVNASAYTLVEHGDKMGGSGLTATGTVPTANKTIAVDPSVIPYGSQIKYNGVIYNAEDTGGVINGNKVDIFVNTLEEALSFGRKNIDIQVKFPQ